jgi:hypothetical protein
MSDQPIRTSTASPALVALAAWIIPGSGYLLLHQRARGLTIGISILLLFTLGLLIGGIRCLDVPGYDSHGHKMYSYYTEGEGNRRGFVEHITPDAPADSSGAIESGWTLAKHPVDEIRSKPWSIAQIMVGPLDLLCDWWSIKVAPPNVAEGATAGVRSHSRVNELGVLYTAVAGMLNLLAIIDASHRASHSEGA